MPINHCPECGRAFDIIADLLGHFDKDHTKRNKYGARRTEVDGMIFDSIGESLRYLELKLLLRVGEIFDLELQPRFVLRSAKVIRGIKIPGWVYIADFAYDEIGVALRIVEDFKGVETKEFKSKRNAFLAKYGEQYHFRISK